MADSLISQLVDNGVESIGRFYSIYRAIVTDIDDPSNTDQLLVYVPDVNVMTWALPFGSHGSENSGFRLFSLPKKNDIVYVLFEKGNPGNPLWIYHGWAENQRPVDFDDPDVSGIVTPKGTKVLINDRTGEVHIEAATRLSILAKSEEDGIVISANKIFLNSSDTIEANHGKEELISINNLTDKLNKLVSEVEDLRNKFNGHTHQGVKSGTDTSAPTINQAAKPISSFNKEDYADKAFLH
jgi:hypothetical protein